MKIRNRIITTFTILTVCIVITTYLIVYIFSYNERTSFFYNQLKQRTKITEQFFLESDIVNYELKEKLKESFSHRLPNELELVVNLKNLNDSLNTKKWDFISLSSLKEIQLNDFTLFKSNDYKGVAKVYKINNQNFVVLVAAKDIYGSSYLNKLKIWMLATLVISILLAILMSHLLAAKILKPISLKIKKANEIGINNLEERLQVYNTNDEIGMLAIAFNNLLDRLENSFELQENFVRYASHELKNPLAVIMGESELLLSKERTINEYISTTDKINKEAEKLNKLVNQFLSLSKVKSTAILKQEIEIDEIFIELITYYKQSNPNLVINLNFINSTKGISKSYIGNYQLIKTAFQNIIDNAIKFSESLPISIDVQTKKDSIIISVKDQGIGIDKNEIDMIFEPLYRSKKTQNIEGTGLGLAIVKNIIDQHSGKVYINKDYTNGTEVLVILNIN